MYIIDVECLCCYLFVCNRNAYLLFSEMDVLRINTDIEKESFELKWAIAKCELLKWSVDKSSISPICAFKRTFQRRSCKLSMGVEFVVEDNHSYVRLSIRLLSKDDKSSPVLITFCELRHGYDPDNRTYDGSESWSGRELLFQNQDFSEVKIEESSIKGDRLLVSYSFSVLDLNAVTPKTDEDALDHASVCERQLVEDVSRLSDCSTLADLEMKVQGATFKGHKAIFAARSAVFAAMLELPMKEQSSSCVEIEDTDSETWCHFHDFIYSGLLPSEYFSVEEMGKLLRLADKYEVKSLFECVVSRVKEMASVDNFFEVFDLVSEFQLSDVKLHLRKLYRSNRDRFTSESMRRRVLECAKGNSELLEIVL